MQFSDIVSRLVEETTQTSLVHFLPELALCTTIVLMLFFRMLGSDRWLPTCWVALGGAVVGLGLALSQAWQLINAPSVVSEPFFTGLLIYDQFTVFFRVFLTLFLICVIALTVISGIPDNRPGEDAPDFYTLLIGATIGMLLMSSANHLLILFLGVEMASVPSYVMTGFLKGRRKSSEAALKFVVYGAGAAGVMLYGISLVAGLLGTGDLPMLAERLSVLLSSSGETAAAAGLSDPTVRTLALGMMLVMVGLAFKLSLFPFHFWCPDAFEGAAAEVAGFLSVASKAAAFALLVRFVLAFAGQPGLAEVNVAFGVGLGVVAAVTATFGNLAAYLQSNIKRLLAYSTIAHAGYMLMAVAALMVIANTPASPGFDRVDAAAGCLEGLLYYLAVYLFMNLGAFAVVALVRNRIFSEEIDDYAGLADHCPTLCVCMAVCMFSLIGMPPFGGFFAKFAIFYSTFQAGYVHWMLWAVLAVAGLNTVFSLFYYMRVLKVMFLERRPEDARNAEIPFASLPAVYSMLIAVPVLLLGIMVGGLSETAHNVAQSLPVIRNL